MPVIAVYSGQFKELCWRLGLKFTQIGIQLSDEKPCVFCAGTSRELRPAPSNAGRSAVAAAEAATFSLRPILPGYGISTGKISQFWMLLSVGHQEKFYVADRYFGPGRIAELKFGAQSSGWTEMYQWPSLEGTELVDATFENAAVGIAHVGLDGAWLRVNQKLLDIVGYDRDELLGITFQDITHPGDLEADLHLFEQLKAGEIPNYQMEKRYFRKDGAQIWANLTVGLQRDAAGAPQFCISVVEDISERKANEAAVAVLVEELNHRVKNTLATVQAVAQMSFRGSVPFDEARANFAARLQAMSAAHDLLTDEKWTGTTVRRVVDQALAPFADDLGDRIAVSGPEVGLAARPALTLAMALNELVTNAMKYGALSSGEGGVRIRWTGAKPGRGFQFDWCERGGPQPRLSSRQGFGTTLLTRIVPSDFHGESSLNYGVQGLHFRLNCDKLPSA